MTYKIKMNITKRYTGFIPVCRWFSLLMKLDGMNLALFGAYMLFIFQADWSKRTTYGTIPSLSLLSRLFNVSTSTFSRKKDELEKLGLLKSKDGITAVKYYDFFKTYMAVKLQKENFANPAELLEYLESASAFLESDCANMQNDELENEDPFNDSFKDDLVSLGDSVIDFNEMNVNEQKVRKY